MYVFCRPEESLLQTTRTSVTMSNEEERNTKDLARLLVSLHEVAYTRVIVDSELSEELEVKVGIHQVSMLSTFLSIVVIDVVTEFAT